MHSDYKQSDDKINITEGSAIIMHASYLSQFGRQAYNVQKSFALSKHIQKHRQAYNARNPSSLAVSIAFQQLPHLYQKDQFTPFHIY